MSALDRSFVAVGDALSPSHHRRDARQEFPDAQWLGQIVVGAVDERQHLVRFGGDAATMKMAERRFVDPCRIARHNAMPSRPETRRRAR